MRGIKKLLFVKAKAENFRHIWPLYNASILSLFSNHFLKTRQLNLRIAVLGKTLITLRNNTVRINSLLAKINSLLTRFFDRRVGAKSCGWWLVARGALIKLPSLALKFINIKHDITYHQHVYQKHMRITAGSREISFLWKWNKLEALQRGRLVPTCSWLWS